jgi:hypothetical protein
MVPYFFAAVTASMVRAAVVSESAAKIPPVWNQRAPTLPNIWSQSTSPGFQLTRSSIPSVWVAHSTTDSVSPFCEIETIPNGSPHSIVISPHNIVRAYSALHNTILDKVANLIVNKCRDNCRTQIEAFFQSPGYVVFTATLPCMKFPRGSYTAFSWIKP